ncbi:hypothetical protein [Sphingobium limneticum]|uniref:Uncharacterized protein n=1 Tax=Sphingobium limneticum TaxID=1007511 RepID=A0A5J5IAU8_9SPHN|nr:hypothetical protein [Sphingobium limneticum]KAA9019611.1 hypothetical protein F4U96_05000 [Sphingobium limneticum]KAA9032069.1 hypothetical protein F4U95_05000 [Sphingobium limneticum]
MENSFNSNDPIYEAWEVEDPLGRDRETDLVVTTTRRALCRMAFVAAETAARFEREGIDHDPVAWMMTPRRLFDGESALDACLDRTGFKRAVILHGLSVGLDALPAQIDALMDDDDDFEFDDVEEAFEQSQSPGHRGRMQVIGGEQGSLGVPRFPTPVRHPSRPRDSAQHCAQRAKIAGRAHALSAMKAHP